MRLVLQLVARLLVVVALCLGAATVWATIDAYRSVDRATAASAERVSQALEALYWRELLLRGNRTREQLVPVSDWRTIETMKLISPGICVRFEPVGAFEKPLCGQSKGIGKSPPLWFAAAVQTLFGTHAAVARSISTRSDTAGTVSAIADPDAAISLAWQHIVDNIHVALLMALAIAFFASLAIAHTLAPAQQIVAALQRMAHGQYRTPLPRFRSMELAMIGQAVGDLGERLAQATEERAVADPAPARNPQRRAARARPRAARRVRTEPFGHSRLRQHHRSDRRAAEGREHRPTSDVAQDARMISQATLRIMACLRDTLKRLRHPPAEELGLEACLVNLVDSWRSQNATQPMIQLDLQGDLADVRGIVAATAYRVAQECLTNSLRHSAAREIVLRIERRTGDGKCAADPRRGRWRRRCGQGGAVRRLRPDRDPRARRRAWRIAFHRPRKAGVSVAATIPLAA